MGNELVNYIKLRLWKIIVSKIILISGSNGQESDFWYFCAFKICWDAKIVDEAKKQAVSKKKQSECKYVKKKEKESIEMQIQ